VIRIPASVGVGHADAPLWEQTGSGGQGRIAPVVLAVVIVCALVGGLAAFAATLGGTTSNPHPAASIAPEATNAPGARAGTRVSQAGARHIAGHRAGRRPNATGSRSSSTPIPSATSR
jgi:hypothetical protein